MLEIAQMDDGCTGLGESDNQGAKSPQAAAVVHNVLTRPLHDLQAKSVVGYRAIEERRGLQHCMQEARAIGPLAMPFPFPLQQPGGAAIHAAIANRVGITQVLFVSGGTRRIPFVTERPVFNDIETVVIVSETVYAERREQDIPGVVFERCTAQALDQRRQ